LVKVSVNRYVTDKWRQQKERLKPAFKGLGA
jgi:hypothetical protein